MLLHIKFMNPLWLNYKLHNTISQHALDLTRQNLHIYISLNFISKKSCIDAISSFTKIVPIQDLINYIS